MFSVLLTYLVFVSVNLGSGLIDELFINTSGIVLLPGIIKTLLERL